MTKPPTTSSTAGPGDAPVETTSVLVVGAGPVGLTLALELNHHGVDTVLVERNATTTRHPKMDITNGRSMELYRRLGVADELRKVAIPEDHRIKVTWATNAVGWELASFDYPSVAEQYRAIRERNDGTLPLESAMRVSQVILEPALRDQLEARSQHVQVHYGWGLESFTEDAEGVTAQLVCGETGQRRTVRAHYLVGCDGAGSHTRRQLGIGLDEIDLRRLFVKEVGVARTAKSIARTFRATGQRPMDGRVLPGALHHQRPADPHPVRHRLASAVPGGLDRHLAERPRHLDPARPLGYRYRRRQDRSSQLVYRCLGRRFDMEVLVANHWTPRLTVADSFGRGRVWLAGDAVHQVTPTGGYGMNTGVGDAVGLGWMLAAVLHGWGTPGLLTAYEQERRAVALRNREAAARHAVVRGAIMTTNWSAMHSERWLGARTRRQLGREISDLGNLENEALGIELGYRYDHSPVVCHEPDGQAPALRMDEYTPSTWPGARPPSLHLDDGQAIFDLFSRGFTLLRFADHDVDALVKAAAERGVPLDVVEVRDAHAHDRYQRDLVLIRPDQHVAWRGNIAPLTRSPSSTASAAPTTELCHYREGIGMNTTLWVLQALLAATFAVAGVLKLTRPIDALAKTVGDWVHDVPAPLIRVIGALEVAGAVGLGRVTHRGPSAPRGLVVGLEPADGAS